MTSTGNVYRFVSKAFTPDTIPQARLAEYLAALAELYGESASVHFVGIEAGSLVIASRSDPDADDEVSERLEAAAQESEAPPDVRKALSAVRQLVQQDGDDAQIERDGAVVLTFPTGERQPDALVYGPFWQRGHLTGTVILVGGKSDPVSVKLQIKDKTITCKAKRGVAKKLRDWMWESPVRVEGTGRWLRDEDGIWQLLAFDIADFCPVDDEALTTTIARLRAVEGRWKNRPDPLAELEAVRHGDPGEE